MFPISLKSLSDQERHDYILKTYVLNKSQTAESRKHKRDIDVIKENHRFLWDSEDCADSWEQQLARRYYDKLFKEYCIADLSRYKENKVALRWRIESEVVSGKGQFQCGSRKCEERDDLKSWEVNFAYQEEGQRKNALVKLRLCPEHSSQLNYKSRKREVKRLKRTERRQEKESKRQRHKHKERGSVPPEAEDETEELQQPAEENSEDLEDNIAKEVSSANSKEESSENIWSKQLEIESETRTRENEFESYLEDLLL